MSTKPTTTSALKLSLQVTLGALSLINLWYAVLGLMLGATPFFSGDPPAGFDNQARFAAGVYLMFPFMLWWIIPHIERHAMPIRIIAAAIMCGGIGRLISLMRVGAGDDAQMMLMVLEICAPGLIAWQRMVAMSPRRAPLLLP